MIDDECAARRAGAGVDDDLMVLKGTNHGLLRKWGVEARAAASIGEAQQAIEEGFVPDLLMVDLRLGETQDGIDIVEALRRRLGRALPALLVSGDTGAAELARARASGIPLLTKPAAPAKLRSMLDARWLRRRQRLGKLCETPGSERRRVETTALRRGRRR